MKIKSLLAAVSMVALTAGAANALDITNSLTAVAPALELQLPGDPAHEFVLDFSINTETGNFPNGNNLFVTLDLPDGVVFAEDLTGDVVDEFSANGVINSGGEEGSSSVTLLVSINDIFNDDNLDFLINVALGDDCPTEDGALTVDVTTEAGTDIEEGTATTDDDNAIILACESALNGVVASDEGSSDTQISLDSDFLALIENGGIGPFPLGSVEYVIDPDVVIDLENGTNLIPTDVDDITFYVTFEDGSFVDSINVGGFASTGTSDDGNSFQFVIDGDDIVEQGPLTIYVAAIDADDDDAAPIPTQTVSVTMATVDFNDGNADLIVSEDGAEGGLDTLDREGQTFGSFDWNAGPAIADPTQNIYRITGLEEGVTVDYTISVENSNNDGIYTGTVTGDEAGEAILAATALPVPADTGRYDFVLNLETNGSDVDVDRLMIRSGVVSAFNDGANNDQEDLIEPNADADN